MGIGYAEVCDWSRITAAVANLTPSFPPGQNLVYHALTYGWLLGEVARRVDGRPVGQLVQEEICRPLGIKTMFIGVPAALEPGVAFLEEVPGPNAPAPTDPAAPASVPYWMEPLYASMNRPDVRQACSPGSNGVMNAAAVARHYASLLYGGVDGIELLPPDRVREATVVQPPTAGYAETEGNRYALGYAKGDNIPEMGLSPTAFGHGGAGGSMGYADPRFNLALGVVRNRFSQESLAAQIVKEVLSGLSLC
jgi:CubicO group peptidase (beta-lactamase class C family)